MSKDRNYYNAYADIKREENEGSEVFPWGTLIFVIGVILAIIAIAIF